MAWKLKRTKSGDDEPKTKGLKPRDDEDAETSEEFEHKPGAFEPVSNEYDTEFGAQDRTVMLLNDDDFLPGLIPSIGGAMANTDVAEHQPAPVAEEPAASEAAPEHPSDENDDFIAGAISGADDAVSELQAARNGSDAAEPGEPEAAQEWDLDAFAPYQPAAPVEHEIDLDAEPEHVEEAQPEPVAEHVPQTASVDIEPEHVPVPPSLYEPAPIGASATIDLDAPLVESAAPSALGKLVVRLGQFSASYEVSKPEVTIGRPDPRIEVFPDVAIEWDDAVSRNHARVLHRADGDFLEDTGSTNGTKLNDKPLVPNMPVPLKNGDRIQLGEKTEISYVQ